MGEVVMSVAVIVLSVALAGWAMGLPGMFGRLLRRLGARARRRQAQVSTPRLNSRRIACKLRPTGPPIEEVAADLRRLLAEHEHVSDATGVMSRGARLRALEAAIGDCAYDAARAVGLSLPDRTSTKPLPPSRLRPLLRELAAAGVSLPAAERFWC